jgi:hypothetical protein
LLSSRSLRVIDGHGAFDLIAAIMRDPFASATSFECALISRERVIATDPTSCI